MIERYQTEPIKKLFDEQFRFQKWLFVETVVAEVEEAEGIIPKGLSKKLRQVRVDPKKVAQIEKVTNHDVIAFLTAVREKIGAEGKWLHFGLTSYDLVDTAFSLIIQEALTIILKDIKQVCAILKQLSIKYRRTPQIGRTHGMFAQPITFGYKIRSWYEETNRNYNRLIQAGKEIRYGKLSGAVGTYAMLSRKIEKKVMKRLGLRPEPVSTQVLPRDRYASLAASLVLYGCGIERIATEIRNLSRSEVGEVSEPFTRGQKGSSAMPHKKNPVICERICGLVRILRGMLVPAYENINLWHERDITNSSVERIIIPDLFHLVHYITRKMIWVLKGLNVNKDRMQENIEKTYGTFASQALMNLLILKGMDRTSAYKRIQQASFQALSSKTNLKELIRQDKKLRQYVREEELEKIFDLHWHLRNL
ncbi:adenylosuccinate lyase [candidate division WOR-3 bacterium 4484_100]|uniref:Adenylosuccinate lyase n=1 Tax=candidate division WOR-3 bacterium 4484_100 TaxID=1936077 RepID=A0A1V4QFN4_UNCW3|nr:MAG: adenylosuccinate lyase [candidate division WOR-3 bacterium 4484_100]